MRDDPGFSCVLLGVALWRRSLRIRTSGFSHRFGWSVSASRIGHHRERRHEGGPHSVTQPNGTSKCATRTGKSSSIVVTVSHGAPPLRFAWSTRTRLSRCVGSLWRSSSPGGGLLLETRARHRQLVRPTPGQ